MKLTPLDIRKQEFTRRVRGVDADEVSAFLQMLSTQWDEILTEQRQAEQKARELESKLQHYVQVEEALQEALRTARESARQMLDTAKQQAENIVTSARQQADEVRRAAEQERANLRREGAEVRSRRDEIAARLRAFLGAEMELLTRFEAEYPIPPPSAGSLREAAPSRAAAEPEPSSGHAPAPQIPASDDFYQVPQGWGEAAAPGPAATSSENGSHVPESQPAEPQPPSPPAVQERDESRFATGWVMKPVIGSQARPQEPVEDPPPAPAPEPSSEPTPESREQHGFAASPDELERIRQILKDLE